MPEKKATYCIDEKMLRKTLLAYSVEVDPAKCSAIETDASALRMQKTISLPDTKVLIKYIALPLLLIASCALVYVNVDSIQAAFTPAPQVKVSTAKNMAVTHAVIKAPVLVAAKIVPPPVENNIVVKKDTVVATNKTPDSVRKHNTKQAMPVIAGPPTDTVTSPKTEDLSKANKPDTASQKSSEPVKKKKKRRRKSNSIEGLKESTLQPNSADDDVVVPQ